MWIVERSLSFDEVGLEAWDDNFRDGLLPGSYILLARVDTTSKKPV